MGRKIKTVYLGSDSLITSLGSSTREVLEGIEQYRTGCKPIHDPQLFDAPFVAGKIDREWQEKETRDNPLPAYTRLEQLFIRTIAEVLKESGIDPQAENTGIVLSTTKGNIDRLGGGENPDETVFLHTMAQRIAAHFGAKNDPLVISNACISGVSAIIVGARLIREERYTHVIVAGGDLLTKFTITGFQAFKSVSGEVCRPYDEARDGLTLGEGCGALLLTADKEKAAKPVIEYAGGAVSNDANHISGPSRTGDGLYFAVRGAMREAGIKPEAVGFVNGHGTATVYNDEMESKAFALAGINRRPLNGLKAHFGHMLGAAGVVETIVCAHELRRNKIYGTLGFKTPGTPQPLDVNPYHREAEIDSCVKTASGFGGCNAALVLRKTDGNREEAGEAERRKVRQTAVSWIGKSGKPFAEMIREKFRALEAPDMKFYKMDDLCKLGYVAAGMLLKEAGLADKYKPEEIGIVLTNRSASLDTDIRHRSLVEGAGDGASPAVFVYTLPNVVAGEICIRHKIQGENTFFIRNDASPEFVAGYARMLIERGYLKAVICGRCELLGEEYEAELALLEETE